MVDKFGRQRKGNALLERGLERHQADDFAARYLGGNAVQYGLVAEAFYEAVKLQKGFRHHCSPVPCAQQ